MPIKKDVANVNDDDDDGGGSKKEKTAGYRLSFVDSCRLIPDKLSDLVHNLSGIHDKKWKKRMERKTSRSECKFIGYRNN